MAAPRDPKTSEEDRVLDKKAIFGKPLADLTEDELDEITLEFGTTDFPFPMVGTVKKTHNGEVFYERILGTIEDDETPLTVLTSRDKAEAFGILLRNMPTRSMLPMYKKVIEQLEVDETNRQFFAMGQPGRGKSHTGGVISKVISSDPARVYDCGGKNLNSFLFEMVLDFGAGEALPEQIEGRMRAGKLNPMSVGLLSRLTEFKVDVVDAETGQKTGEKTFATALGDGKFEIDWVALSNGSESSNQIVTEVFDIIQQVASIEGFDKAGGNMLGMNSQFGPAITDFIDGNFATWDEYNKSKEGGDDQLQTFLQFVNGEIDECTVENPLKGKDGVSGPESFTFRREDVKPGWGLMITGNNAIDGTTTRALNKSVYSRLSPEDLAELDAKDWQDFITSYITGVPISLLYDCPAYKTLADQDEAAFADFLWQVRTAGMSKEEVKAIPKQQKECIREWRRIYDAAGSLGGIYHEWRMALDADQTGNVEHMDEIDDPDFAAKQAIDFRRVIKDLRYAMKPRAQVQSSSGLKKLPGMDAFNRAAKRKRKGGQSVMTAYGTRLTNLLNNRMYENSVALGKPKLYDRLQKIAESHALTEISLQEGARSDVKTVESLLNITRGDSADPNVRAEVAQEVFCKMLRDVFPEISADASDDDIVTVARMREIMEDLEAKTPTARDRNELAVANDDIETIVEKPLIVAKLYDTAATEIEDELIFKDILTIDEFLESFVLPGIRDHNLNAVWEDNVTIRLREAELENQISQLETRKMTEVDSQKELKKSVKSVQGKLSHDPSDSERETLDGQLANLKSDLDAVNERIKQIESDLKERNEKLDDLMKNGLKVENANDEESDISAALQDSSVQIDMTDVMSNRHKSGLSITTVFCREGARISDKVGDDDPRTVSHVHILRSAQAGKTLVIAKDVSESVRAAFEQANVKYVALSEDGAAGKIDTAVADLVRGMDADESIKTLRNAFEMRNTDLDPEPTSQQESLGDILARQKDPNLAEIFGDEDRNPPMMKFFVKKRGGAQAL